MKKQFKQLVVGLLCMTPALGFCGLYNTELGKIEKINTYAEYKGGAVLLSFNTGLAQCPTGLWISPTSTGFDMMSTFALASYMSNKTVYFGVEVENPLPVGTNIFYCQVDSVRLGETK
ncbi:MAG: hypothetical protein HRT35_21275 [Algicola sp.]|nr:hypothetical protein [Algicola sp.]